MMSGNIHFPLTKWRVAILPLLAPNVLSTQRRIEEQAAAGRPLSRSAFHGK